MKFLSQLIIFLFLIIPALAAAQEKSVNSTTEPITSLRCNEFIFDASGSYDPENEEINFFWDFGDGTSSSDPVIKHTYTQSGDFEVVLTITDNSGLECSTAVTSQIVRANIPPIATFNAKDLVCANEEFILDATGSYDDNNAPLKYRWKFGDGTFTEDVAQVAKVYSKGGNYKIALTVDDQSGTVCSATTFEQSIKVNEPPVAEVNEKEILKCVYNDEDLIVNFNASNSSDINNDPLTFEWDFGDGFQDQGPVISHQYSDVGNYDVKLVVKDSTDIGCGTGVDFVNVRLNKAPEAIAGDDVTVCPGEKVYFDGSQSYAQKKGTLLAKWFFGDGESSESLKVEHVYSKPGQYQASLSVENALNAMCPPSKDTRIVTVNSPPSVAIKAAKSGCTGASIDFDASAANDPDGDNLEYYWTFGDGTIERSGAKVSHEYIQGGTYTVSVIVDDGLGTSCSTATTSMEIKINTPPVADAGENLTCCVDKLSEFNGSASSDPDGDALTYKWDFGDGNVKIGAITQYTYKESGSYNVFLTVDDNQGTSCSKSSAGFVAEVNSTPVPVINIR
ncbi:MAG: PKD domain-containing protein [Candidatus Omnitrophica bacterium]|nr:PKD domain-containing protein [Candidatus Omnitrophota bacterium]MCB9748356.1 PKD domain-containing protein [Candidatus Omnitrophota bacterium]